MRADVASGPVPIPDRAKVVVIGAGPGGSITAALFAEAGHDVIMLEEGDHWPLSSSEPFSLAEMEQKYRNGGLTLTFGAARVQYVEGRCVGGGSEINSGLYHRTPDGVLDAWMHNYNLDGATPADLLPDFEMNERDVSVSYLPGRAPEAALRLRRGAEACGWSSQEVPRWFKYDGSLDASGVPRGTRQSMTETFVPRFLNAGGKLFSRCRVQRLERRGTGWLIHGVQAAVPARPFCIRSDVAVIAAGAVQTPTILLRSGVGRHVGRTLQLHPTAKVVAEFDDEVTQDGAGVPSEQVKHFSPEMSFGCSISSKAHMALSLAQYPDVRARYDSSWRCMATYYTMALGTGVGRVRSVRGFRDPVLAYRLSEEDGQRLAKGLERLATLLFAAGAARVYPVTEGAKVLRSPADLRLAGSDFSPSRANLMTIHLFSSCPMGELRDQCTVDSYGNAHGEPNLMIADASILCTSLGVNPQGSVMAFARRNARYALHENKALSTN
jgi:choline dehydrogenase-like flavoprotein